MGKVIFEKILKEMEKEYKKNVRTKEQFLQMIGLEQ